MELYYLWQPGVARDAESQTAKREAWRAELREYDADPDGWNRRYYRQMLVNAALRRFEDRHESSDENE